MRQLTKQQANTLDRIAGSAAGSLAKVVGWAMGGPVLHIKNRLVVVVPTGVVDDIIGVQEQH